MDDADNTAHFETGTTTMTAIRSRNGNQATDAEAWTIDEQTILLRSGKGFSIVLMGTEFGPVDSLEDLCEGALLDECQSLIETPGRPVSYYKCDFGPFGDIQTILIDPTSEDDES